MSDVVAATGEAGVDLRRGTERVDDLARRLERARERERVWSFAA
ncbi:MAG: hypothetical protein R3A51_23215 [Nannocystaceae bacterium]